MQYHIHDKTLVKGDELLSSWYIKDSRLIRKRFFTMVRVLKNLSVKGTRERRLKIIEEYNNKLEKCYNDHRNILVNDHTDPSTKFEPVKVQLIDNTVTFDGLSRMAEIFTNQSVEFFTYLEIGTSDYEVDKLDGALGLPLARINVLDLGWFEPKGNTIQTGSMFPEDTQGGIISEAGAFDKPVGGKMWWRVLIEDPNRRVETVGGITVPSVSHIHMLKSK
jgi:hypothetical protein